MGLTAAIELTRQGYQVSGISTKELYDLCSWRAAGYFALVSVKTSPEEQGNLNEIGVENIQDLPADRSKQTPLHQLRRSSIHSRLLQ